MPPTLSIIIPVLNEAPNIVPLLRMLARQEGICFETIICDGGSTDATLVQARNMASNLPYDLSVISAPPGRGRQMNAGTARATGEWLLFLHADSHFPEPGALRNGLFLLTEAAFKNKHRRTAGRFTLRFDTSATEPLFGYYLCERKARLDRIGCIMGDQGLLLSRKLFQTVGPFDEELSVAEDVELAERIRSVGTFILLPDDIVTSPRRFQTEGYRARRTLNAMILALLLSGYGRFLEPIPGIYRSQDRSQPLQLEPFFAAIAEQIGELPVTERWTFWYRVGKFTRANAWQPALLLDLRRAWQKGVREGETETPLLAWCDTYLDRMTNHPPGILLATALAWGWFNLSCRWQWLREGNEKRADSS